MQSSLPWTEKYRPKTLGDLVSHQEIINTISKLIDEDKMPHLLFYGPPGTGKTSTILACARRLYGNSYQSMILELNASDERQIDVVRNRIKEFASTRKIFSSGVKLVVLDEADAMTNDAQAALRRVIEKYTTNTRFCLICNYIGKITPAIQSRCTRFRFAPLRKEVILPRLREVIQLENVKCTPEGLEALIKLSAGDMRKCLNILEATSMAFDIVNEENIYLCTGNPTPANLEQVLNWLLNTNYQEAFSNIRQLKTDNGLALQDVLKELHLYVLRIDFPDDVRMQLLSDLSDIEYRLSLGTKETLQLGALVGSFQIARVQTPFETGDSTIV